MADGAADTLPPRARGWDQTLPLWAFGELGRPYLWGETDCCALALRALAATTLAPAVYLDAVTWRTMRGARRDWQAHGGLARWAAKRGAQPLNVLLAQARDIVIAPGTHFPESVAVVLGRDILLSEPGVGVYTHKLTDWRPDTNLVTAWRFP